MVFEIFRGRILEFLRARGVLQRERLLELVEWKISMIKDFQGDDFRVFKMESSIFVM